jgi:hypothetical protein
VGTVGGIVMVSDRLARFNRRITNPIVRILTGRRLFPVAVVVHHGRTSDRRYRTPVIAFRIHNGYLIALPYGAERDWVKNVGSAGSCTLERFGRQLALTNPRLLPQSQGMALLPWPALKGLALLRTRTLLRLSAT